MWGGGAFYVLLFVKEIQPAVGALRSSCLAALLWAKPLPSLKGTHREGPEILESQI